MGELFTEAVIIGDSVEALIEIYLSNNTSSHDAIDLLIYIIDVGYDVG